MWRRTGIDPLRSGRWPTRAVGLRWLWTQICAWRTFPTTYWLASASKSGSPSQLWPGRLRRARKSCESAPPSRARPIIGGDLASTRRQASRPVRTTLLSPYPGGRAPSIPLLTFYRSFVLAGADRQHSCQRPAVRAQPRFAASAGADTYEERVPGHNWARARQGVERQARRYQSRAV